MFLTPLPDLFGATLFQRGSNDLAGRLRQHRAERDHQGGEAAARLLFLQMFHLPKTRLQDLRAAWHAFATLGVLAERSPLGFVNEGDELLQTDGVGNAVWVRRASSARNGVNDSSTVLMRASNGAVFFVKLLPSAVAFASA